MVQVGGGALIPQEPFLIAEKLLMRLKVTEVVISYYEWTSRPLTAGNIKWDPQINNVSVQWKDIQDLNKNDDATLTNIPKKIKIVKWFEAYEFHVSQVIGQANTPLTRIIRENVAAAPIAPALEIGKPHSMEHVSVKLEMVHGLPHTQNLYAEDNTTLYLHIVEATLGTKYDVKIAPFKRARNERGAYLDLKSQFAGTYRWDQEIK